MTRASRAGVWSGYGVDPVALDRPVTSDRLSDGDVANRWFPKVRSWFALGAPLELLSPLSVARIVALVGLATWPAGIAFHFVRADVGVVLVALSVVMVWAMLRLRVLASSWIPGVLGIHLLMTLATVATCPGDHRATGLSVLLAVKAIFAGLFLRAKILFPSMFASATLFAIVMRTTQGAMGLGNAVVMWLFAIVLGSMTAMMVRTSRMSGTLDPETGLPNVRGLADRLLSRDQTVDVVIATVHLSGVAEVRDALGHHAGSELVRRSVEDLGQVLPASAVIGRGADDDVVVLMPNRKERMMATDESSAILVRKIARAIGTGRYLVGDVEVALNTHIGLSVATAHSEDGSGDDELVAGELLRQSALAARSARDRGLLYADWSGESTTLTLEDLELLASLRTADERGELWIAYQPQVRTPDGRIVAVEALLRWSSERHGFVPPGRFIPLAERTGLVDRLTDWVLAEALDAQTRWIDLGLDLNVSVNVSPLSLRSVDFADRVRRALAQRSLDPSVLMLEVTESMAFDIPEAVERLAPLRELGVRISIDDFGTGYTSLSVLPQLPLDELKVDQQFVRGAIDSPASEAIVRSVCELAHRLGLSAVAEGVEDAALADLMTTFGFDLLQGYHFAKPMAEDDLVVVLQNQDVFTTDGDHEAHPTGGDGTVDGPDRGDELLDASDGRRDRPGAATQLSSSPPLHFPL